MSGRDPAVAREADVSTIVVPLDGSSFAESALPIARGLAERDQGTLRLVRVSVPATTDDCDRYLQEVAAGLAGPPISTSIYVASMGDRVSDGIAAVVGELPDALVCMTAHGRSGLGAAVLGSNAEDVLHRLGVPVVVVGPRCADSWPAQPRMVVPLDGSGRAERILPRVAWAAEEWSFDAYVVQVAHPLDTEVVNAGGGSAEHARWQLEQLGVPAQASFQVGPDPAAAITRYARQLDASLIVMSTYINVGVARTLLGSVTMQVIHRAPCPVLVCPPSADADERSLAVPSAP